VAHIVTALEGLSLWAPLELWGLGLGQYTADVSVAGQAVMVGGGSSGVGARLGRQSSQSAGA